MYTVVTASIFPLILQCFCS